MPKALRKAYFTVNPAEDQVGLLPPAASTSQERKDELNDRSLSLINRAKEYKDQGAKLSNRAFFIDDSLWDRGVWIDHFQPLPNQGCRPPEPERMRGCPRGTRHWVVSSKTVRFHFAQQYQAFFENPKGHDVGRKRKMFDMARDAFIDILIPSDLNQSLIKKAERILLDENGNKKDYIGVHLRRGDRRPMTWKYRNDYIPLENFVEAVNQSWTSEKGINSNLDASPTIFLATDTLAILPTLVGLSPSDSTFLTLNSSSLVSIYSLASPESYQQLTFTNSVSPSSKISFTRGMIVDFALLTGGWGGLQLDIERPLSVVCTLSSNICKMSAVALGWEKSFEEMKWVNIDGRENFDWRPTDVAG